MRCTLTRLPFWIRAPVPGYRSAMFAGRRIAAVSTLAAGLAVLASTALAGTAKPLCAQSVRGRARTVAFGRAQAQRTARRLMDGAPLPAGATAVTSDPSQGGLLGGSSGPARFVAVHRHRYFRIPGSWTGLEQYQQAHPPRGECPSGSGGQGPATGPPASLYVVFGLRHVPAGLAVASTQFSYAAARGGGAALRIDVWVVWLLPRPPWERLPSGVGSVVVSDVSRPGAPPVATIVTPSTVAAVVRYINALPRAQPGVYSCPVITGPKYALRFRSIAGVVLVTVVEQGCGDLSFALGGRRGPPLVEPSLDSLAALLHRLGVV